MCGKVGMERRGKKRGREEEIIRINSGLVMGAEAEVNEFGKGCVRRR